MNWPQRLLTACGILVAVALLARWRATPDGGLVMPGDDPTAIIESSLSEIPSGEVGVQRWHSQFAGRSGTAKFDILMEVRDPRAGEEYAFTRGSFVAHEGSNAEELLAILARAHHGTRHPKAVARQTSASFATAILGRTLSRGRGTDVLAGEFTPNPPGRWIVAKIFLPPEDAEMFVAINATDGTGLLIPKDDEYWNDLEPVLASVL